MTQDGSPESPPEEEAAPAEAPTPTEPLGADGWGQAARAACLSFLIGMALIVTARLAPGGSWAIDLLQKNKIPMDERMAFIVQMLSLGVLFAGIPLGLSLWSRIKRFTPQVWEGWAWFLSPAILLPAIPVVMRHEVWARRHEDLLPVVLFGALIAELLLTKSFAHIPEAVTTWWSKTEPEKVDQETSRVDAFLTTHAAVLIVVGLALAYGAFMSFYTIRWHHKLGTATFDLGINNNLLYGGLEGRFNQSPVIFPEDPQKYLANHVKIGLYSLLPIYALYPKAETLLAIQSISLGLGAIPLFLFARRRIPQWWAVALAAVYLAYYPMHGANFYEMKIVPTSAALVLTCIWAIDSKRFVTGGIFFVWAMIMREDMPVPLAVVGAVFLLSGHRPRAGIAMAGVATIWFIFIRFRFMNDVGDWWFPNMYEDLWAHPEKGFRGVIKTLVSNPTYTLKHIFVEKKFWYLMHLLVPMAFIPVRRWWAWAALVPGAILTLLVTDYAPPTMFSFQYVMHWSPYLFIVSAVILGQISVNEQGRQKARAALVAMCLASLALTYNYGAFPTRDKALESGYHKIEFSFSKEERKTLADVRRLVASIPVSASVASTERIGAHLSSRVGFYTLRRGSHGVDYIVARKSGLRLDKTKETVRDAMTSEKYGLIGRYGEFAVLKKGAPTKGNDALLIEWGLRISPKAQEKAEKTSKNSVRNRSRSRRGDAKVGEPGDDEAELDEEGDTEEPTQKKPGKTPEKDP